MRKGAWRGKEEAGRSSDCTYPASACWSRAERSPSPPPALQPTRHPLCKESVQNLLCQEKGLPALPLPFFFPPNPPSFLPCNPKSRADATMGFLRSAALPRIRAVNSRAHRRPPGALHVQAGCLHAHIQLSLLITPPSLQSPGDALGDA